MCFSGERRLGSGWGARGLMERDEGKFFLLLLSSFIACEQAPLFGQAKRASRKCANEGPFPWLLARLASLGPPSKRFQSSYCAKDRAEAKKKSVSNRVIARKLERTPFLVIHFFFLLSSQVSRRTSRGNACFAGYASLAQVGELACRLSLPWGLHQFPGASTYPRSSLTRKKVRVCILKDCQHIVKKNPVARSKISTLIKSPRYFFQWIFNLSTVTSYSRMEGESLPRL